MAPTYNWSIESIDARKVFTDKHGNVRQNVIKNIVLVYTGKDGDREEKEKTVVGLSIVDLTIFKPLSEVTNEEVLQWAVNKLHPKQKERIETFVRGKLEGIDSSENMINIVLND